MQSLHVVERLFEPILTGEKTSTIRWRETPIEPGDMTYISDGVPEKTVVVWVTMCKALPLSDVAAFLGKQEDWPDGVLLEGMREHYPDIELADVVQVVEHLSPAQTANREAQRS